MADINQPVRDYLKDYFNSENPNFAVMVKASWGAGKTHIIKDIIADHEQKISKELKKIHTPYQKLQKNNEKILYISLYDIHSQGQINHVILSKAIELSNYKPAKMLEKLKSVADTISVAGISLNTSNLNITEFIKDRIPEIIVFDDIERSKMQPTEILAAVNKFVEHENKKIVLIGHEDFLQHTKGEGEGKFEDEYFKNKEKVIGQTLAIQPDFDAALEQFLKSFSGKYKKFLKTEAHTIREVFELASHQNLRSLEQALWSFERIYKTLNKNLLKNENGMRVLLTVSLAFYLEIKAGELKPDDMNLKVKWTEEDNQKTSIQKFREKYDSLEYFDGFATVFLIDNFGKNIFHNGILDPEVLYPKIKDTVVFQDRKKEEEWVTVWHAWNREEKKFQKALDRMQTKFKKREYLDPGVMLHVFSCKLELVEMGLTDQNYDEIEYDCREYIEDLKKQDKLKGFDPELDFKNYNSGYGYSDTTYKGIGYPIESKLKKSEPFKRLMSFLRKKQDEVFSESGRKIGEELLGLMSSNIEEFQSKLINDNTGKSIYAGIPILLQIEPLDFSNKFLELSPNSKLVVLRTLKIRYESGYKNVLKEKEWIRNVRKTVLCLIKETSPFNIWQVKTLFGWTLDEQINHCGKQEQEDKK